MHCPLWSSLRGYLVQFASTPNAECMRFFVDNEIFLPQGLATTMTFDSTNSHQSPLAELILTALPMVAEVTIGQNFITVRRMEEEEYKLRLGEASGEVEQLRQASGADDVSASSTAAPSDIHDEIKKMGKTDSDGITELDEETMRKLVKMMDWSELKLVVSAIITDHLYSGTPHIALDAPHPHQDTFPMEGDSEVVLSIKELIAETIRPELQKDGGDIRFLELREGDRKLVIELLGACKTCKSSKTTLQDLIERTVRHWIPEVTGVAAMIRGKHDGALIEVHGEATESPLKHQ